VHEFELATTNLLLDSLDDGTLHIPKVGLLLILFKHNRLDGIPKEVLHFPEVDLLHPVMIEGARGLDTLNCLLQDDSLELGHVLPHFVFQ